MVFFKVETTPVIVFKGAINLGDKTMDVMCWLLYRALKVFYKNLGIVFSPMILQPEQSGRCPLLERHDNGSQTQLHVFFTKNCS